MGHITAVDMADREHSCPCSDRLHCNMGCGFSGGYHHKEGMSDGLTASPELLEAYLEVENAIWREEQKAPAPAAALSFATARLEALNAELSNAQERQMMSNGMASDDSLRTVIMELRIHRNEEKSAEHEEFIANLNRQILVRNEVELLSRRENEAEEEVKLLNSKVNYLQGLYEQEDQLLSQVFGETYGHEEERRTEMELDKLRSFRDTLAGGEMEWREASGLVQQATELLERAIECWKQIGAQTEETRFHLATETRNLVQEAALYVQMAQGLLPGVQFPYCTPREVTAVLHAIVYIFTDIQIPDRYSYGGKCYANFHERARALTRWLKETTDQSLRKDLEDVDRRVAETTERLRKIRVALIRNKMGNYPLDEGALYPTDTSTPGGLMKRLTTAQRHTARRPGFVSRKGELVQQKRRDEMLWHTRAVQHMGWDTPAALPGHWGRENGTGQSVVREGAIPGEVRRESEEWQRDSRPIPEDWIRHSEDVPDYWRRLGHTEEMRQQLRDWQRHGGTELAQEWGRNATTVGEQWGGAVDERLQGAAAQMPRQWVPRY